MTHQQEALTWMLHREKEDTHCGLLADDVGLKNTRAVISLIVATKNETYSEDEDKGPNGGTLVICPTSVLCQWKNEIKEYCESSALMVSLFYRNTKDVTKNLSNYDVVITTYNTLSANCPKNAIISTIVWKRIILDEAHTMRNTKTKIHKIVCDLSARCRWALTGTPFQNTEHDLDPLLKLLHLTPTGNLEDWKHLILRRTKDNLIAKDILKLPKKFTSIISINLDDQEKKLYKFVQDCSKTLHNYHSKILLRQVCCHPHLLQNNEICCECYSKDDLNIHQRSSKVIFYKRKNKKPLPSCTFS